MGEGPADIVAEEQRAQKRRIEPGMFKGRNEAPNLFVEAAPTPGEVAQTLLTIFCYLGFMFGGLLAYGVEKANRIPGIFQAIGLGLLIIPAMMLSSFIWGGWGWAPRFRPGARALLAGDAAAPGFRPRPPQAGPEEIAHNCGKWVT